MATATDNFNRADGSIATGNWDAGYGTAESFAIVSNVIVGQVVNNVQENGYIGASFGADQFAQIQTGSFNASPAATYSYSLHVRKKATPDREYYFGKYTRTATPSSQTEIRKILTGSGSTQLASETTTNFTTAGDKMTVTARGSNLSLFKGGANLLNATDSGITATTVPGLGGQVTTGGSLSDMQLDNFAAGDLSSVTVRPSGDGTTTGWSKTGGTGTFASCIVDDPDSNDGDTSYVLSPNVTDGSMWVELDNMPSDFDLGVSADLKAAIKKINTAVMTVDLSDAYLQVQRSDESTAITAESSVCNVTVTASYTLFTRSVNISGTQTKTNWDAARLKLRFDHTTQSTVDTVNQIRITAAEVIIWYVPTLANAYTIVAAQGAYTLTGQAAALLRNRRIVAAQGIYALSGQAVTLKRNVPITAAQGSYSLSGQSVNLLFKRSMPATRGSYVLSGQSVNLLWKHLIAIVQGAYTLTGQNVALTRNVPMAVGQGSYALSGQAASLLRNRLLGASQGAYALSGQNVSFLKGRTLVASEGNYVLSGQNASLLAKKLITASFGSYALSGKSASLLVGKLVSPAQGSYSLTGKDVTLTKSSGSPTISAGFGSYALSGQAVVLLVGKLLAAAQGSYALTGKDVALLKKLTLVAARGNYALTGEAAAFLRALRIAANAGFYTLTGEAVNFVAPTVTPADDGILLAVTKIMHIRSLN